MVANTAASEEHTPHTLGSLFPFRSHFITIAGHRMHYIDEGQGSAVDGRSVPTVLLLHGNPTWSFYYRELIAELKSDFRVIAPDFIGLGLSDHPTQTSFRAADRIQHLEEFIDKLELDTFSIVMHDWGGSIGSGMAISRPDKIERIVYLNTTLTETEALPPLIKIAATPYIGKLLTKYSRQFLWFTTTLGVNRKLSKDIKNGYYLPYRTSQSRRAIWDFVDDIPFDASHPSYSTMLHLAEELHCLSDHEVQIVWGLQDPCFHREMLSKVVKQFPDAELIEIADASHLVLEDAPEIAIPSIVRFLKEGPEKNSQRIVPNGVSRSAIASSTRWDGEKSENALLEGFRKQVEVLARKPAVIEPLFLGDQVRYGQTSFRDLQERIYKYERGLVELGLALGDRVLMLVPPGVDFLALTYAVIGRGGVPVFLDPGMGRENLKKCIREIDPHVLIGSPRAQLLRIKRRELMPNLKFHVTASEWIYTGGPRLSYLKRFSPKPLPPVPVQKEVFLAFTSGATGKPKGVVFTNEMLSEQLKIFKDSFGLEAGKKDMPLLPVFSLFHIANGVCCVFPSIDPSRPLSLSPERVFRIIHDLEVDYSFGSPTLWNKIVEYGIRAGESLGSLEKIFMAGAPVPHVVRNRVQELVGNGKVYTPYGATEALPVTLCPAETYPEQLVSSSCGAQGLFVGESIPNVALQIVQAESEELTPVAAGEIGEVVVSGKNVSPAYYQNEEATQRSKVMSGDKLWHRMGDYGYVDQAGGLYYCGRIAHMVQSPTKKYYSVPTELIFNQLEKVKRSALVSLGEGEEPGIVIEPYPEFWPENDESRRVFLQELEQVGKAHPLTEKIRWYFFHPSFPVDGRHNAKIFRDQLGDWARQFVHKQEAA